MITLTNVTKIFGKRTAVSDLSLEVKKGDVYGLLGHNGAGKSTAIGMMLGQVWPSKGSVSIGGYSVASQRRQALQNVGAIFESPVFYDYLSGWRNLEILTHYSAPTPTTKMLEVLEWVGLTGREHSKVRTYSHGMRARLALAQALLPHPDLLILDEPGDGLDPEGIHELRHTILRLNRELNLTLLLSSHLLGEVEQLCNRIAVLNQGKKVFEGPISKARQSQDWVRLKTDTFDTVAADLQRAGLIQAYREGSLIALNVGVTIDQVVRYMVQADQPVHEICPHEKTLETFYLDLMKS